ncbi:hypothetical protein [Cellulomonas chengniuliangii]|uniref:Uncharacterized protein n=1 Tax=Cellulomonas chengniuliangii TaxID=2968084 RepID=A0ABY5KYQ5_9CELL|nr:hypothetical protein [Cellulomonas chengniuliangii]MCC2307584.1 hypothetical protein [Cellulomonas chengniuliangii]MCC2318694.1 hypothetical protein [Cellulomonas chengniuliangii]UUI75647.1 hypothetical protein NP064_01620 [Cellulomonas chengniuliangii]
MGDEPPRATRMLYSRRSRRQLADLADAPGSLEALQLFGPRDDDGRAPARPEHG